MMETVPGVTKSQTWLSDWTELMETDIENRLMDTGAGGVGEGRMYAESGMETYTLP